MKLPFRSHPVLVLAFSLTASLETVLGEPSKLDREISSLQSETSGNQVRPEVWIKLGNTLMQKSRQTFDESLYGQAETAFLRATEMEARNPEAFLGVAWTRNSMHQFEDGARWARRALALDPDLPRAYALLGDGAVELGEYEEAFEHYQKALDLKPNLSSYSRASHLLWLTGSSQKAQWLMQKAIGAGGAYPENTAWCRSELALTQFHAGALVPAQKLVARALHDAPNNPRILTIAGRLAIAGGDKAEAKELLERAVALVPQHDSLAALVDLAEQDNDPDQAESYTEKLLALHGAANHAHSHDGNHQLARFLADHDRDLETAIQEAERAYLNYRNIYAADTLAWCYFKAGRLDEARRTIRKALQWNTPDASLLFHAGMIYAKLEKAEAARSYLYRAINLNPNFHPRDAAIARETLKTLANN